MKFTLAILLLSIAANLQAESPKVPDTHRYKMLNTYQKANAILSEINNTIKPQLCAADKACMAKADEFAKLLAQLKAEEAEAAKAMGLPEDTQFEILPATDSVTVAEKKAAPKPEAKKQ